MTVTRTETLVITETDFIAIDVPVVQILEVAQQGMQGPPGPAGQGGTTYTTYTAGAALGGHRAVRAAFDDTVLYADHTDMTATNAIVGVTLNAASLGADINVAATGSITEPSWSWVPNLPIFVGSVGALTQAPPSTGFQCIIAVATSATSIQVALKTPIIL